MRLLQLYKDSYSGLNRNVWLLAFVTLINRAGTIVLPFLTLYLTKSLGYSLATAGLVTACYGAGSVLGTWLGGKLTDLIGFRRVIFTALFTSGFLFLFMPLIRDPWLLGGLILVIATIGDAFRPANFVAISTYSKSQNLTRSIALIRLAINFGFALGPLAAGIIAYRIGYGALFWIDGLTCMAAALLFWFLLPQKEGMTKDEKLINPKPGTLILAPTKDFPFLLLMSATLMIAFIFMQLFSTIPVFLEQEMGINEKGIGYLMAFNGLLISVLEMPMVFKLENRFDSLRIARYGAVLIAVAYIWFLLPIPAMVAGFLLMFLITIGEILNFPFVNSYVLERSDRGLRGSYMGFYGMTFSVGVILANSAGMALAGAYGFDALWILCCVLGVLAVFALGGVQRLVAREG